MTRLILAIVTALTLLNSVGWENSSAPTIDADGLQKCSRSVAPRWRQRQTSGIRQTKSEIITNLLRTPLHFIENRGQLDESVAYYAKADGATIFCTNNGITFGFRTGSLGVKFYDDDRTVQPFSSFAGSGLEGRPYAREKMDGTVNYTKRTKKFGKYR